MEEILQLIGGKHPIIYSVSTIQGGAGFRNHPQYVGYMNILILYKYINNLREIVIVGYIN